jgi:glycosyltransferase involved in cell wall biosynthesis
MNPFFSIIIPTYNRGHIVSKTIQSVINQNFQDWELIVVDDGSTDNTKEIIESFSQNDLRIRYIYQSNQERSAARNNGIENSNGKYICFLDSDDEYDQHHLSTLFDEIKIKNNAIGLFFTSLIIYNNGIDIKHPIKQLRNNESIYDYLFTESIYPCRVCISKEIFNDFTFPEYTNMAEDTILWLEIASKFPIFQILEKTVNYYQHEENSVNKKFNPCKKMLIGIDSFKRNKFKVYSKISRKIRVKIKSSLLYGVGFSYIINNNRFLAILYIAKSLYTNINSAQTKHKVLIIFHLCTFKKLSVIKTYIQ